MLQRLDWTDAQTDIHKSGYNGGRGIRTGTGGAKLKYVPYKVCMYVGQGRARQGKAGMYVCIYVLQYVLYLSHADSDADTDIGPGWADWGPTSDTDTDTHKSMHGCIHPSIHPSLTLLIDSRTAGALGVGDGG